jgi:hypothetical protein
VNGRLDIYSRNTTEPRKLRFFFCRRSTALLLFSMVNARRSKPLEPHSAARGIMS